MTTYHNSIAVVGRAYGDEAAHVRIYEHMTLGQARHLFITDVRREEGCTETDIVAGFESAQVHIDSVLVSTSLIEEEY